WLGMTPEGSRTRRPSVGLVCKRCAWPKGRRARWPRRPTNLPGAHPVVLRVVGQFGQAQRLEERRHVDAEPAAEALLETVPAAYRVARRAAPCLDRPVRRRFLLVRAAQRHPVTVLLEHRVEIVDRAQVV